MNFNNRENKNKMENKMKKHLTKKEFDESSLSDCMSYDEFKKVPIMWINYGLASTWVNKKIRSK